MDATQKNLLLAMAEAERKAWDALGGYKFWMFGYHAARWVGYNQIGGFKRPNPWSQLVMIARPKAARLKREVEQQKRISRQGVAQ